MRAKQMVLLGMVIAVGDSCGGERPTGAHGHDGDPIDVDSDADTEPDPEPTTADIVVLPEIPLGEIYTHRVGQGSDRLWYTDVPAGSAVIITVDPGEYRVLAISGASCAQTAYEELQAGDELRWEPADLPGYLDETGCVL